MKVLIIGSNEQLRKTLHVEFSENNCSVSTLSDKSEGIRHFVTRSDEYDLVILDFLLTERDARSIYRAVKRKPKPLPILSLAQEGESSTLEAYAITSVSLGRLSAIMRALIGQSSSSSLRVDDIELDPRSYTVTQQGRQVNLTPKEFSILEHLMKTPNRVVRREHLIDQIWEDSFTGFSNVIDVHVNNIRRKLNQSGSDSIIQTVRGIGYKMRTQ